jgi:hypothetical protein
MPAYQFIPTKGAKWKGTKDIKEAPDSPVYDLGKDGAKWTRTFNGPFTALIAACPKRLQSMSGFPGFLVDDIRIAKAKGTTGTMTVTLCTTPLPDPDSNAQDLPVDEIEWVEVNKKLETHKRYQPGGDAALTDPDLDKIEEWKNATLARDRSTKFAALTTNAADFAAKVKRGQDSFNIYAPVVRVTTTLKVKPNTGKCGFRDTPPRNLAIAGYVFLKTADRATRQNRTWQRVEEWTGATVWDTDIYPAS